MAKFYTSTLLLMAATWIFGCFYFNIEYKVKREIAEKSFPSAREVQTENVTVSHNVFSCTFIGNCSQLNLGQIQEN